MFINHLKRIIILLSSQFFFKINGQIKRKHQIGRWIEFISSLSDVDSIVEIGTWNGRGSSRAIARGVLKKGKQESKRTKVVGFEINPAMYEIAKKALRRFSFFEVVLGSIIRGDVLDRSDLTPTEIHWLEQDEIWIENAPYVIDKLPNEIDLLILDGGEFSSYAEFEIVKSRVTKWVILDDTNTRKCKRILSEVKQNNSFRVVWESNERHGTAVLFRIR